jgi:ribosomal protein L19
MVEKEQMRGDIPAFKAGDTVKVYVRIIEGQKQRIQALKAWSSASARQQPGELHRPESVLRYRRGKNFSHALAGD